MSIQNLFEKRDFIKNYIDKSPPKELINKLIEKTYYLVPSKQNLVPYSLNVFGPECIKQKEEMVKLTTRKYHDKNPNIQLLAPYVILFNARLTKPNKWVESLIKKGHSYNSCNKDKYLNDRALRDVLLEIGMFTTILTGLCLENKIDTAYTLCQFSKKTKQNLFDDVCLFIMSLGYRKNYYTKDWKKQHYEKRGEVKPKIEDIVIWK